MPVRAVKAIGAGTPEGAHRYQAAPACAWFEMIVGLGVGGFVTFGIASYVVTRIDRLAREIDLLPVRFPYR